MPKESNIVHRYLRKKSDTVTVLIKINPISLRGLKLTLMPGKAAELHQVDFEETIWDDLNVDGFEEANALEFNLYYSGLVE
jgi:hypothetical protein